MNGEPTHLSRHACSMCENHGSHFALIHGIPVYTYHQLLVHTQNQQHQQRASDAAAADHDGQVGHEDPSHRRHSRRLHFSRRVCWALFPIPSQLVFPIGVWLHHSPFGHIVIHSGEMEMENERTTNGEPTHLSRSFNSACMHAL